MKKTLSIFAALMLVLVMFCTALPVSAAGASVSVTANSTKPTVGSTVTVTVKYTAPSTIGSIDASLKYDSSVLEYVSTSGITASGGSGVLKFSYFETSSSPSKTKSFTVTFKTKKAGSSAVSVSTSEIADWTNYSSLGSPAGSVTVNVQNPQKSGNANLSALYISSGSLSPKFSPKVTSYNIVIPNSVTVLTLSAETEDKDATIAIEGSKNMKVGKNTRKVIVTAPNGTTKTYTLNITRQEATGNATTPTGTGTTAPQENNDAAKVTVGEETLYIAADLKDVALPHGYEQVELAVNDAKFPSVQDKSRSIVLLYLTDAEGKNGAFYVYDTASMTFSDFVSAKVETGVYAFLMPDTSTQIPDGFTQEFIQVDGKTVVAWAFPQAEMQEYHLVYALSPAGTKGLYQYDTVEGTFQRYTHAPIQQAVENDVPMQDTDENGGFLAKFKSFFSGIIARFGLTRLILITVGVVALVAALIVLIVLLVKRPKNCKH